MKQNLLPSNFKVIQVDSHCILGGHAPLCIFPIIFLFKK